MVSLGFFIDIILPATLWPSLTEMSTTNISCGGKGCRCVWLTTVRPTWAESWNQGASNSCNPQDLSRPVQGLLYLYRRSALPYNSPVKCALATQHIVTSSVRKLALNPLNAELNPICHLLALLGTHHILHVSMVRVNLDKGVKTRHVTYRLVPFFEVCVLKLYLQAKCHEPCVQVRSDRLIQGVQKVAVIWTFNSRSI